MSLKLKVLGLGILATMAMGAVAVVNASATAGGHLFTEDAHTIIKGSEIKGSAHQPKLLLHGFSGEIECDEATYSDYTTGFTDTEVTITPTYKNCQTEAAATNTVTVTTNNCHYTFTTRPSPSTNEQTVHLSCPSTPIEIHHPSCTITIPSQTISTGVTYTNLTNPQNGKHELTLDLNAQFNTQFHGGICIFTGTNHTGTLTGYATAKGFDTGGTQQFSITAT